MSKNDKQLNIENLEAQTDVTENVEVAEIEEAAEVVEIEEVAEEVVERDLEYFKTIAAAISKQNPKRAREIVKERLSQMSDEQITDLRVAKEAKIEAERLAAAEAEEEVERLQQEAVNSKKLSDEQKAKIVEQLAQLSPRQIEAIRQSRAAKAEKEAKKADKKGKSENASAKTKKEKVQKISYESKQAFTGFMFVLPWFIGFLLFFAIPCFQSLKYSFSQVSVFDNYACTWAGIGNYKEILTGDANFMKNLTATLTDLAINVPIILIFSLFVAVLLNRKFVGRGLVRGIFFLPVIVTTGIVMTTFNSQGDSSAVLEGNVGNGVLFEVANASEFLGELGLNEKLTEYMTMVADRIFDVVWDSGIQILLFLAALQGISPSLYEASDVEGATAWETFWLITFPNVAPIILVNIVYTIVDTFSDTDNAVLRQINTLINSNFNFGGAAAASWIFFLTILLILGVVFAIFKLLSRNSQ